MRILVAGGLGFIGSHTVDRLVELGHSVTVVDNCSTGMICNRNDDACNIIVKINKWNADGLVATYRPEVVFDLCAKVDVGASVLHPTVDLELNLEDNLALLDACQKSGVRKFVFASSLAVYGNVKTWRASEYADVKPENPYGVAKLAMEEYVKMYGRMYGMDYTILRYTNTYGPRQRGNGKVGVIPIFIQAMLKNADVRVNGKGMMGRDFLYVSDCVDANVKSLHKGGGEILNIGTGVETKILQLFGELATITGYNKQPIRQVDLPSWDVERSVLDCRKAAHVLGWTPKVGLAEGLQKTVDWWRKQ